MSPQEHQKFTHYAPYAVMVMIALVGGIFFTVLSAQQQQNVRSKAATGTPVTIELYPVLDTYVSMTSSSDRTTSSSLRIKGGSSEASVALMAFNLGVIPAGSTITSVQLKMHTNSETDAASGNTYPVNLLTSTTWSSSLNWNNKPGITGTSVGTLKASSRSTWYTYNLTPSAFQTSVGRPIAFAMGGTSATDGMWFDSNETSYKPKLVVTFYTGTTYYPTPTPTNSYYPSPTPTKSYYPTPTPTVYNAPTPTPTAYVTPTPSPTPYVYVTPTPTAALYPTNTPVPTTPYDPGTTAITFNLALHGLGKGGDAANPNGTGNTTPLHPQRTVMVEVYDASNALVQSTNGLVTYDSASGLFSGLVSLGDSIASGAYTVKVKTDQFLRTLVPGIQTITSGQNLNLPKTAMVGGDINNDNQLNILDYNILIGCYSDLSPAANCAAGDEVKADITDDGNINQFDYNLFLRELTNRGGQ